MEGEKTRRGRVKHPGRAEKGDETEGSVDEEYGERDGGVLAAASMEASLSTIRADIKTMAMEMKSELGNFRDHVRDDLKKELADIRAEIQQKLGEVVTDLKATNARVGEAESRIADIEEWTADFKEALGQSLQAQESLQKKLTDLEARSRSNNIRIYGIAEGAEENNIQQFIHNFIKKELEPLAEAELGIQRCHRALGPKPPKEAQPRSVIVYFQEFKIKELVLHSAWKKKEIYHGDRRIYFDNDYPAETLAKRKAYAQIKRILREKGLKFQTLPPAKLRVFFDNGPITYGSAEEAAEDLKKRGFSVTCERPAETGIPEKIRRGSWQRTESAAGGGRRTQIRQDWIKERLRSFQRPTNT